MASNSNPHTASSNNTTARTTRGALLAMYKKSLQDKEMERQRKRPPELDSDKSGSVVLSREEYRQLVEAELVLKQYVEAGSTTAAAATSPSPRKPPSYKSPLPPPLLGHTRKTTASPPPLPLTTLPPPPPPPPPPPQPPQQSYDDVTIDNLSIKIEEMVCGVGREGAYGDERMRLRGMSPPRPKQGGVYQERQQQQQQQRKNQQPSQQQQQQQQHCQPPLVEEPLVLQGNVASLCVRSGSDADQMPLDLWFKGRVDVVNGRLIITRTETNAVVVFDTSEGSGTVRVVELDTADGVGLVPAAASAPPCAAYLRFKSGASGADKVLECLPEPRRLLPQRDLHDAHTPGSSSYLRPKSAKGPPVQHGGLVTPPYHPADGNMLTVEPRPPVFASAAKGAKGPLAVHYARQNVARTSPHRDDDYRYGPWGPRMSASDDDAGSSDGIGSITSSRRVSPRAKRSDHRRHRSRKPDHRRGSSAGRVVRRKHPADYRPVTTMPPPRQPHQPSFMMQR